MKFVFLSNYLSPHQLPFCQLMYQQLGNDFHFIATIEITPERLKLGYPDLNTAYPFVVRTYEDDAQKEKAYTLSTEADVVMIGSAPMDFVKERLKQSKLTFCYHERLYKIPCPLWKYPIRLLRFFQTYGRHKSLYLLCASAYTAGDFAKTFTFLNKSYKWGYFPAVKHYDDIHTLIKQKTPASILWAGRFIDWKHPENVITVAQKLKQDGYHFQMNLIGTGELEDAIKQQINELALDDCVHLLGSMPPEQVRTHMEQAAIYLFTSDRNEGWGAVLNESMNSGCAVVASDAIGAVPFLLEHNKNGLIYKSGDVESLYQHVKRLLDHPDHCTNMGMQAYETMTGLWNAEEAVQRLLTLCQAFLDGEPSPQLYASGPCSKADILKNKHANALSKKESTSWNTPVQN